MFYNLNNEDFDSYSKNQSRPSLSDYRRCAVLLPRQSDGNLQALSELLRTIRISTRPQCYEVVTELEIWQEAGDVVDVAAEGKRR